VRTATWVFYACMTLFVGLASVSGGGALVLARFLLPRDYEQSGEPFQSLLVALTLAVTIIFLGGAAHSLWHSGDQPRG